MILRNGKLITKVFRNDNRFKDNRVYDSNHNILKDSLQVILKFKEQLDNRIGAIYKGSKLVWLTVYDAIRSCFGGGTWIQDRPWISDDVWKNN